MKLTTKERKKFRIRSALKKVSNSKRYRLSVFRSSKNISAQIISWTDLLIVINILAKLKLTIPSGVTFFAPSQATGNDMINPSIVPRQAIKNVSKAGLNKWGIILKSSPTK